MQANRYLMIAGLLLLGSSAALAQDPGQPASVWHASGTAQPDPNPRPQLAPPLPIDLSPPAATNATPSPLTTMPLTQVSEQPDVMKQIEILAKQIETQQKMIQLLRDQMQNLPGGSDAQGVRSAQRDFELSHAIDNIAEHQDSMERYGPNLPSQVKELFLPSGNNETPLTIAGALAVGYSAFQSHAGGFYFGEFSPDFFVKLNDWILLEAEIGIGSGGSVSNTFLQADFIATDWLTIIGGKFVAPVGFYNERLNNPWINKLPADAAGSAPLPWGQVLPATQILGLQARGSFYLGKSPFKMEYSGYFGNGLNFTPAAASGIPSPTELYNLEGMTSTDVNVTGSLAFGGRLGLWYPEAGLEIGVSGLYNGPYIAGFTDSLALWAFDFNYHKGDWDVRAEYGLAHQQTQGFLPTGITREGVWAQVAYRPRDLEARFLRNTEFVYRFGYTDFSGIDPALFDPTMPFSTPVDEPVGRFQHEFGINYYFYPRMVLKFAYQVNIEPAFPLHDNQFMTELAWGW